MFIKITNDIGKIAYVRKNSISAILEFESVKYIGIILSNGDSLQCHNLSLEELYAELLNA